jgi:hypothetical protein
MGLEQGAVARKMYKNLADLPFAAPVATTLSFSMGSLIQLLFPQVGAVDLSMDPPSYEESRLTSGCANLTTNSASSDIMHFLEIAREQTGHLERVKAMFTATEAVFWIMTSKASVESITPLAHVLGAAAQYSYLYLRTYNIATQNEELDFKVSLQLQHLYDRWQMLLLEHPLLHVLSIDVCPLRRLSCDRAKYRYMILSIQSLGYQTIELALDRSYASVLYGGQVARMGFPQSYEWTCPHQEGKRRRQIRRLLNDAGIEAPERQVLRASVRGWCVDCGAFHLK